MRTLTLLGLALLCSPGFAQTSRGEIVPARQQPPESPESLFAGLPSCISADKTSQRDGAAKTQDAKNSFLHWYNAEHGDEQYLRDTITCATALEERIADKSDDPQVVASKLVLLVTEIFGVYSLVTEDYDASEHDAIRIISQCAQKISSTQNPDLFDSIISLTQRWIQAGRLTVIYPASK